MYFSPVNKQLEEHKVLQQPEKWGNFILERELYYETFCPFLITYSYANSITSSELNNKLIAISGCSNVEFVVDKQALVLNQL